MFNIDIIRGDDMDKIKLYKSLEKRFCIFRWFLVFFVAPVTIPLSDYFNHIEYYIIFVAGFCIYNTLITIAAYSKENKFLFFIKNTLYIDIIYISIIVFMRGGLRSDTFLLYFLIILYDGAKYGYKGTILSLAQSIFYYTIASVLAVYFVEDIIQFDLNRYVIRLIYLISLTFVMYEINKQISESNTNEKLARELAYKDPLTKLPNRLLMSDKFDKMRTQYENTGQPFGIVIIDIDNFKQINDTRGHNFGDKVLQALAKIFNECLTEDDFMCRFGGEEFLAFFANSNKEEILYRVNLIHKKIKNHNFNGATVTVSIGINMFRNDLTMIENISLADEAMYAVKNTGKNKVLVYEDLSFKLNRA